MSTSNHNNNQSDSNGLSLSQKALAGATASATGKTIFAPFERVKLILQNQNMVSGIRERTTFRGFADAYRKILQSQGIVSFWRGNGTNLARIVPTYGMRFAFFDFFRDQVSRLGEGGDVEPRPWQQMAAGALSGFTTVCVTHPLDLIRTRLSTNMGHVSSSRTALRSVSLGTDIIRAEGARGLYKGFVMSAIEITPYLALTMGGYELLKSRVSSDDASILQHAVLAWMSGMMGSVSCYPMDTVKRQLMLDGDGSYFGGRILNCVKRLYRQGGHRIFYRGCLVNCMKSAPVTASTLVLNDIIRDVLLSLQ